MPQLLHLQPYGIVAGLAQRGKSSRDWFYGCQLHFAIHDKGALLDVRFTPVNVNNRVPVPDLAEGLWGKLFGDRGYLSQELFERLQQTGVQLIAKLKRNIENKLLPLWDKLLLQKQALIENGGEQLNHTCQIEHTRHRSAYNAFVPASAALVAYTWQERKLSLHLTPEEQILLAGFFWSRSDALECIVI